MIPFVLIICVWFKGLVECNPVKLDVIWSVTLVLIIHDLLQASEYVKDVPEMAKALNVDILDECSDAKRLCWNPSCALYGPILLDNEWSHNNLL